MRKELITYFEPKSPESEMFRNLRTNIQFMNTSKELRTLLITSTMPGEGKSYVSSNLAVTFAQAGKKVILVDCDMRKGRQFSIFGISPRPGISNYLSGVVDQHFAEDVKNIENYIQQTEIENLSVIPAGSIPPNPAELLVSDKMCETINILKEKCDLVILDAPPALIVADSVILARRADSCVIVTAHNQTRMDEAEKVKNAIENVGGKIAGIVINKIPASNKKYGNKYYYYYGSEDMYGDNEPMEEKNLLGKIGKRIKDFFTIDSTEKKKRVPARKRILNKRNRDEDFQDDEYDDDDWYDATDEWNASEEELNNINDYDETQDDEYEMNDYEENYENNYDEDYKDNYKEKYKDNYDEDDEDDALGNIFSDIKYNLKQ